MYRGILVEGINTDQVFCRPCYKESAFFYRNTEEINDDDIWDVLYCDKCGRDAAYPLHRDYKLYKLDGGQCRLITGLTYDQLRENATQFFPIERNVREDQNAPLWDKVLELSARDVWEWRKR
jgi:hypothetical protein